MMNFFDLFSLSSLVIFIAAFLGRTFTLASRGVRAFVIGAEKRGIRAAMEIGAIFLLALFWVGIVLASLGVAGIPGAVVRPIFAWLPARVTGTVLAAFGVVFFIAALGSFGRSWRVGIDTRNPGRLATGGVFRWTRNPIFLSMDCYYLGITLIYPCWPFIVMAVAFVVGVHFQILEEEKFLFSRYGEEYREYCRRVPRYAATRATRVRGV
jgi:protein-S-isoprenylcysteine O-methyltransferase Ste14